MGSVVVLVVWGVEAWMGRRKSTESDSRAQSKVAAVAAKPQVKPKPVVIPPHPVPSRPTAYLNSAANAATGSAIANITPARPSPPDAFGFSILRDAAGRRYISSDPDELERWVAVQNGMLAASFLP